MHPNNVIPSNFIDILIKMSHQPKKKYKKYVETGYMTKGQRRYLHETGRLKDDSDDSDDFEVY